jgi:hypothetical protein
MPSGPLKPRLRVEGRGRSRGIRLSKGQSVSRREDEDEGGRSHQTRYLIELIPVFRFAGFRFYSRSCSCFCFCF